MPSPGRSFNALIEVPFISPEMTIRLQVLCKQIRYHRYRAEILWKDEKDVSLSPHVQAKRSTATADFWLPPEVEPTGYQSVGPIFWQLKAFAVNNDSNFTATFDIPVFNLNND